VKRIGGWGGALGLCTAVLGVVTLVWHDWIETVFGVDPDAGSGAFEVLIVIVCFAVTLAFWRLAWIDRRKPAASRD
jgi:hypothetical protein